MVITASGRCHKPHFHFKKPAGNLSVRMLSGDFYILPSSVHELILMPVCDGDPESLRAMIRDANETIIDCEDMLSDDLYICREGNVHKFAA